MSEPIYFYTKLGPYFELSNFAPFGFESDGKYWPTVEHFFQAQKFEDTEFRERIRSARTAKEARALGQSRRIAICTDWEAKREGVMLMALRLKFQRMELKAVLQSTGNRVLVEASPFDHYWGAGRDGTGQNRLGILLMQLRDEFAA